MQKPKARRFHPLVNQIQTELYRGASPLTAMELRRDFDFVDPLIDGVSSRFDNAAWKSGERKLLLAMLEDALALASLAGVLSQRELRKKKYAATQEAVAWIRGARVTPGCFSFGQICDHLGLDEEFARAKILSLRVLHKRRHSVVTSTAPRARPRRRMRGGGSGVSRRPAVR